MRLPSLALLTLGLLGGCAGNVADYIGPRAGIVSPQLIRYGLSLSETRCVGEHMGSSLSPLQLRRFVRASSALKQGFADPGRLTLPDLLQVAASMNDPRVKAELDKANSACGVTATWVTAHRPAAPPPPAAPASPPAGSAVARSVIWLNLGSASTGQSIAIDASTIEQQASVRTAWFRLTDPGAAAPGDKAYLLRIDCAAKTIRENARRRPAAGGGIETVPGEAGPLPIEGGTVMEIAYLALCT